MVEVTEMFYGTSFALDKLSDAREFVNKLKGVNGWKTAIQKDKWCFRTYFTFKIEYENKEVYEKSYTLMNNDFVKGLELLGYTAADFNEKNVTVSVLEYSKPMTFREWRNK